MNQINVINSIGDIFNTKTGKIKKFNGKCYRIKKWVGVMFRYYYSGIVGFVVIFLFLLQPHYFDNLLFQFTETIILYLIFEFILSFLIPICGMNEGVYTCGNFPLVKGTVYCNQKGEQSKTRKQNFDCNAHLPYLKK